jgi:hypothetical protein
MPEPNSSLKPPSSSQSIQINPGAEEISQVEFAGVLVVEHDRYIFKFDLFNDPDNDNLAKFAWVELGKVKVHYNSDLEGEREGEGEGERKKTTDHIELYPDPKYAFNVVFEDRLDQMHWKNLLKVRLHFNNGAAKYTSERGEQTIALGQDLAFQIRESPKHVLRAEHALYRELH